MGSVEKIFRGRRDGGAVAYSESARFMTLPAAKGRVALLYHGQLGDESDILMTGVDIHYD